MIDDDEKPQSPTVLNTVEDLLCFAFETCTQATGHCAACHTELTEATGRRPVVAVLTHANNPEVMALYMGCDACYISGEMERLLAQAYEQDGRLTMASKRYMS